MGEPTAIPKIIHQTYKSWDAIPAEITQAIERSKAANPDWEYRFYDDAAIEQFLQEAYPWAVPYFHRINPVYGAARADFFRYLLMLKEGGLYLDIKSVASRSLSEVLQGGWQCILSQWDNGIGGKHEGWGKRFDLGIEGGEFQQWFICAVPRHPFLQAVVDRVRSNFDSFDPRSHPRGQNGVIKLTGPCAFSQAIIPVLDRYPHCRLRAEEDLGLLYSTFANPERHRALYQDRHYMDLDEPLLL